MVEYLLFTVERKKNLDHGSLNSLDYVLEYAFSYLTGLWGLYWLDMAVMCIEVRLWILLSCLAMPSLQMFLYLMCAQSLSKALRVEETNN